MAETWHSLYLHTGDFPVVVTTLIGILTQHDYRRYDPFPGGSGTPPGLKSLVKHFVAPAEAGWIRILGTPDPVFLPELSEGVDVLHVHFSAEAGDIVLYRAGQRVSDGLSGYLGPDKAAVLDRAEQDTPPTTTTDQADSPLPDEFQQLARDRNVNPEQASKLTNRLIGQLFGKLDRDSGGEASAAQAQARAMIGSSARVDWNSPTGRHLSALAQALALPGNWREPDFDSLREAYQVARRLARNPGALLLPDEQAALNAVPNAIRYEAVYMGK